ncbi:hypothetical protein ABG768_020358 [Culter alburnus]|uniref:Transposase n=1 Tax=Culter alburnus TaxID=194366 RepID=A0AAW2B122_CULAL
MHSRKRNSAFVNIRAICTFPTCKAQYIFLMERKPASMQRKVSMTVYRRGQICHLKVNTRKRQASNVRRGKIAKVIHKGVSQVYYNKLRKTPVEEILAGNLTRSLNRDVLKVISSEVKKTASLHDNILLELHLTQQIIKECDTNFRHLPGYIQSFQVDPFCCHMYTEKGISILATHTRKSPVTLYLDATGSVGHGTPPLPIAEMLTNDHTVPSVSFWLMQFVHNLSKYTTLTVRFVETDYSWALIQAVLLAFNRESVLTYLDRCFDICQGKDNVTQNFTIIHLCSAHVLKAVAQAVCKHVTDKGHREFVIFVFARLQNSQTLDEAVEIFRALCIVLHTRSNTASVKESVKALQGLIQSFILDIDMSENRDQVNTAAAIDDQARTVVGRSRFSAVFRKVFDEATTAVPEDGESTEENVYHSPRIIQTLFKTYMAIFPMWSGVMLGDLKRHSADKDTSFEDEKQIQDKTRETNCHVEGWFSIVKQHILQKARRLRPGNFVRKMYASLQGRYIEHIILLIKLLKSPRNLKDIRFAEESWAKKEEKTGSSKAGHSKFYSVPPRIPGPKKKAKSQGTTTQATLVTETDAKEKTSVSKHEEDTSAPKKKQTGKPKICDNVSTAKESGTKSKMTSIDDADLSSMTTIGNDVAATLETTPQNVQKEVCKISNTI